ncbi:glycosyltransferase family 4 protein [Sphingobium sp. AN558]|uniref:glycosyltransferase family 4 protein n=1 Tax=Sphingobium sp. AN558 TaxID=3133442 RepID=UPI0030C16FCC
MSRSLDICIIYDCLFPWTIGGAERWYRALAERLAADGHRVTYLTMTQWSHGDPPDIAGVTVLPVAPRANLYDQGKRRIVPPMRFGWGVLRHLARHGRQYDVVHLCSFPYFALLAAGLLRRVSGYRIVCDWFEVWSRDYWRDYLGRLGWLGWMIQHVCAKVPQRAQVFSRLHMARLKALGLRGNICYLSGLAEATRDGIMAQARTPPTLVYAGRMIPEKRLMLLVEALAIAHRAVPDLRAILFGNGPERDRIATEIARNGLDHVITMPGFVEAQMLEDAMRDAVCIAQPSAREGYGLVVVEASARGVPAIIVAADDNAAVELVEPGVNGFIADPATPQALASAIIATVREGETLRQRTRDWYAANVERLSIDSSLLTVVTSYVIEG